MGRYWASATTAILVLGTLSIGCGGEEAAPGTSTGEVSTDTASGDTAGQVDTSGPCTADDECPATGIGACERAVCDNGTCGSVPLEADAACDDGDPCTLGDKCVLVGDALTCEATTATCDDGDACNGTESCGPDGCANGTPLVCGDENACNGAEACNPVGGCVPSPALECKDDGNPCNGNESCEPATGCVSTGTLNCDDGSSCTVDSCDPVNGCIQKTDPGAVCCSSDTDCDDGNQCTTETCEKATGKCSVVNKNSGACESGAACAGAGVCQNGDCIADTEADCATLCTLTGAPGEVVECTVRLARTEEAEPAAAALSFSATWPATAKLLGLTNRQCVQTGQCTTVLIPESGNALQPSGHSVVLSPNDPSAWETQVSADMVNLSSADALLSKAWIENEAVTGEADLFTLRFELTAATTAGPVRLKGLAATAPGAVSLTVALVQGVILTTATPCGDTLCADLNACTADACAAGQCTHSAGDGSCDDRNPCTTDDTCNAGGTCVGGLFVANGAACPVDDLCTETAACDGQGTCNVSLKPPPICPDQLPCLLGACDSVTGECSFEPMSGASCSDADACTEDDLCSGAGVCAGTTINCEDGIACSLDDCDKASGCEATGDDPSCEDGDVCTVGTCSIAAGGCQQAPGSGACNDGDPCTKLDVCSITGCAGTADAQLCGCQSDGDCVAKDDGNPCTGTLVCDEGVCALDPSTVVECPPDGYACTVEWACNGSSGTCAGTPQNCDDGIGCTIDACDPQVGCTHVAPAGCVVGWLCELSGASGDELDCAVRLAAKSGQVGATGMDVTLRWKSEQADLIDLVDTACFGAVCFEYSLATCATDGTGCVYGTLEPTKHVVVAVPNAKKDWATKLALLSYHPSAPTTALTQAVVGSGGSVTGESAILVARFKLKATVTPAAPMRVEVSDIKFNASNALPLPFTIDTASGQRLFVTEVK